MPLSSTDVALVTGASSGIGEATVIALRERGIVVHAAARRIDRLEDLAERTGCIPHQLDVRDRAAVTAIGEDDSRRHSRSTTRDSAVRWDRSGPHRSKTSR